MTGQHRRRGNGRAHQLAAVVAMIVGAAQEKPRDPSPAEPPPRTEGKS